jgi:hypothetical protein
VRVKETLNKRGGKKDFKNSQTDQTWKKVAVNGKEIGEKRPM